MENQTTTNKQPPSNQSATVPGARPLSPIQNRTVPSVRSPSVGAPSVPRPSAGATSVPRPSFGAPSAGRGRPSAGKPSVGAPSAGRPSVGKLSVGRGRRSVGARSVGARSLGTQSQPVPKLSQAAEQALAEKTRTIRIIDGRDFVYPADLRLLRNDQHDREKWLNDSVINVYCDLILDRSRKSDDLPNIYVFPTRFGVGWKLGGFEQVQEWCRAPPDLFTMELVFFPLNTNNSHWVLVTASPPTKTIAYYDSMNHNGSESRKMVASYLSKLHEKLNGNALDLDNWDSIDQRDIPQQDNGFDCGVFVCQYAERLSRRAPLDFTQDDMPAIRVRMIEDIVTKHITPPSPRRPHSEPRDVDNVRLYRELCDLRAENAKLLQENAALKEKAENANTDAAAKLKDELIKYRDQVQEAKQKAVESSERVETAEREAAAKVDLAQTAEREATAKEERIKAEATTAVDAAQAAVNLAQATEREATRRAQTAERVAADLRTELETERRNSEMIMTALKTELQESWKEIDSLRIQLEEARAQATETEAERPDEEPATRSKTPRPTSSLSVAPTNESSSNSESSSSSSSDDSPPDAANASRADRAVARRRKRVISPPSSDKDDDAPLARRRRIQPPLSPHSAPTQILSDSQTSDEGPIPSNRLAQVPPPPPRSIYFGRSELIPGHVDSGNAGVTVNYPTHTVRDFPPISPPALNFHYWLENHGLSVSQRLEEVMRRDLESRRRFLMDGNLSPEDRQFVISRIPPAYEFGPNYLLALAGLALHSFDVINPVRRRELVFALLYCFSRWNKNTLNKFLNQNL